MISQEWEQDKYGWLFLSLDNDWIFLIDPNYKFNQGYDVLLVQTDEIVTRHAGYVKQFNLHTAKRMCEKLKKTGDWMKYIQSE